MHHEAWFDETLWGVPLTPAGLARIKEFLDPSPLIVPPVLTKIELTVHPVLRLVWSRAWEKLKQATDVIFLGYSFPTTDLAAKTLFQETLTRREDVSVQVVSVGEGNDAKELQTRYENLLRPVPIRFEFDGAESWIRRNTSSSTAAA